jgi:hypothetical protein
MELAVLVSCDGSSAWCAFDGYGSWCVIQWLPFSVA